MAGTYKLPVKFDVDSAPALAVGASYTSPIRSATLGDRSCMPPPASIWRINTLVVPCLLSTLSPINTQLAGTLFLYDNYDPFFLTNFAFGPVTAVGYLQLLQIFSQLDTPHDLISGRSLQWQWQVSNVGSVAASAGMDFKWNTLGTGQPANGGFIYDEVRYDSPTPDEALAQL